MSDGAYWAVLTAPILESRDICDGTKLFYAQISRFANGGGLCWASNKKLSEELGVSERTITRYVSELENAGFISTEFAGVSDRKRRGERRIRLAQPCPFKVDKNVYLNIDKNGEDNIDKNVYPYKESNTSKSNNPLEPPKGGPRVPEPAKWKPQRFEAFWKFYRERVNPANRGAARKAWDKLRLSDETIDQIAAALVARLRTDSEWRRGIGRPHASTYLNGQMWMDAGPTDPPPASGAAPAEDDDREENRWIT